MGVLIRRVRLAEGETIVWTRLGGKYQGSKSRGGRITLTTRRLVFEPHIFDRMFRGRAWSMPLAAIRETFLVDPRVALVSTVHGGGWMPLPAQLGLRMLDGTEETMLLKHLEEAVSAIEGQLQRPANDERRSQEPG